MKTGCDKARVRAAEAEFAGVTPALLPGMVKEERVEEEEEAGEGGEGGETEGRSEASVDEAG